MRDWENLRYFLAVAREGSVSGAARQLQVSHSTVLRRIEQFETATDAKLFKKLQRGYELTTTGEALFADARSVEADIDRALSRVEGQHDVAAGKLRISQPEHGIINLYPYYSAFLDEYPEVSLEIQSTMQEHNLNQQEVDLAFRFIEEPPEMLVGRKLGKIKSRIYASESYLERFANRQNLKQFDWIVWDMMASSSLSWLQDRLDSPRIVLYAATMPDVLSAVRNGMGVGFLSSHEADKYPELVSLLGGKVVNTNTLWLLTHRELRRSERVTNFMRFMAEKLQLD